MPENPEAPNPFHEAIAAAKQAAQNFVDVASDPFKAPEQLMELIIPLQTAMYFLSVEWTLVNRRGS